MRLISNKNIAQIIGTIMTLSVLTSCEKENVPHNTKYKWEKINNVEYYHNKYHSSEFNFENNEENPRILGIKFPHNTSKIEIYDLNRNKHFDIHTYGRSDFMITYDSVKFQDTTFYSVIDVIHSVDDEKKTAEIDSLFGVHLKIVEDYVETNK